MSGACGRPLVAPTAALVLAWALLVFLVGCHPSRSPEPGARSARARSAVAADTSVPSDGSTTPASDTATAREADQEYETDSDAIGDEPEDGDESPEVSPRQAHPFDALSDAELIRQLQQNPEALGTASLGRPNAGALLNAVQLPENAAWKRVDPSHAWSTPETIEYLTKATGSVAKRYPGTAAVSIGHLSAQKGGPLRPHVSHQSGRDVDVGFYFSGEPNRWYKRATADNLDLERTWWLVRMLVLETNIEMILLDQSLIELLERHALSHGEDREWVHGIFHPHAGRPSIVRHASGHATHLHLRFFNPVAQESGRRLMPLMVARGLATAPQRLVTHVARTGDTLAKVATRYASTMQAIRQANAMNTFQLVAGKTYRIPVRSSDESSQKAKVTPARPSSTAKGGGRR